MVTARNEEEAWRKVTKIQYRLVVKTRVVPEEDYESPLEQFRVVSPKAIDRRERPKPRPLLSRLFRGGGDDGTA